MKRPLRDRFNEKVRRLRGLGALDCWIWVGCKNRNGYGQIVVEGTRREEAHRVAWRLAYGDIPAGKWVLHTCDNPPCVRPSHLYLGDQTRNMADMAARGRSQRGERHHNAKLNDDIVRHVREVGGSSTQVAAVLGLSPRTVRSVRQRKTWAHVPDGAE